jgi:large subunit ribosomal protein L37e
MTKGIGRTSVRNDKSHITCRRCGKVSFHIQKKICASCGYGHTKHMRRFTQHYKALRRRTEGTGRMRYKKSMARRFKNGFREGTQAKSAKAQ